MHSRNLYLHKCPCTFRGLSGRQHTTLIIGVISTSKGEEILNIVVQTLEDKLQVFFNLLLVLVHLSFLRFAFGWKEISNIEVKTSSVRDEEIDYQENSYFQFNYKQGQLKQPGSLTFQP